MTDRFLESLKRQVNGLIVSHRIHRDRLNAVEVRCAALEQATLELAALRRAEVSPEGLGSLPSPSGDDTKVPA